MRCGLVGPSDRQRSLPFNGERTINLYSVFDKRGKDSAALYGTPGMGAFSTGAAGNGRHGFTASNERAFCIFGYIFYEISSNGALTARGTIDQSVGNITTAENGTQLAICDGASLYIFTYATNAFQKVVDANLPSAGTVCFIDGYFVVNRVGTGIHQASAAYNGLSWPALSFATAEGSPDALLAVLNVSGQLWLFGVKTTEIWYNSGAQPYPFSRVSGGKIDVGTCAQYSPISLDNSAFWIGKDNNGFGMVFKASGFTPQRISTDSIEKMIQAIPDLSNLKTFSYQQEGHTFLLITGGTMETTLVYDLSTNEWHERAYLNGFGNYEPHLASYIIYAFDKHLVISRSSGDIYTMSLSLYDDNGNPISRERIFTHIIDENKRFVYTNLTVGFETGVGTQTGQGVDPKATLYISRDGCRTWTGGISLSIGAVGNYFKRVIWRRLGQSRITTFRIKITDPVKVAISGAWFNT